MAFNKRGKTSRGGEKKNKRQPCTYYVCVFQEMHSVKHLLLTLEAWAHLKECVLDFISLFFLFCGLKWMVSSRTLKERVLVSNMDKQHWETLLQSDYIEKQTHTQKKTNKKKTTICFQSRGHRTERLCRGLSMWTRIHSRFWRICLLYFCLFLFLYTYKDNLLLLMYSFLLL